jgi:hypothetical protein
MNSWNQSTSYANNVKLYNLDIPDEYMDLAYEIICGDVECVDWEFTVQDIMNEFLEDTGYAMGFNGRSGGYIVMYDTKRDSNGKYQIYPGRNIDMYEDFKDWSMNELKERVSLVMKFDEACDMLRDTFIDILKHSKIQERTYTTEHTVKYLEYAQE